MKYWTRCHNVKYEFNKRVDRLWLVIAMKLPSRLRMWVVVDSTNTARRLYPDPTGYAGPDGLNYAKIYDGALKTRREE